MAVPKGRRSESRFEASHHFYGLRREVTELILNDFGYSHNKAQKKIDRYRKAHEKDQDVEEIVGKLQKKTESFEGWFIDEEARAILELLRKIEREFTVGNSIYPSDSPARIVEFLIRRYHVNNAIGLCYSLKQEINYVIRTLPVDINKYERFAVLIDEQVNLYKGVRQADNRLIKPQKDKSGKVADTLDRDVIKAFDAVASAIRKIGRVEAIKDENSAEQKNKKAG